MSDHIRIRQADGKWSVRAGGAVLVESSNALEVTDEGNPPVIYFPREDVAMALLEPTDLNTDCPTKGEASYFSIVTPATTLQNAAWSYETPKADAAAIATHIAFYSSDQVTVEQL